MHEEAFNGGVAAFEAAVRTGVCPYLSELGDAALGEVRGVYEQLDAGNYDALEALAERLASAMEQPVTTTTKPEVVEPQPESLTRMDWAASKSGNTKANTKQDAPIIETRPETANPVPPSKPEAVDNGSVEEAIVQPVNPPPEAVLSPLKPEAPLPLRPEEATVPDPVVIVEKSVPVRAEPPTPIVAAKINTPPPPKLQELYQDPPLPVPVEIIKTEPASAKIAVEEPASEAEGAPTPVLIASENVIITATEAEEDAWPAWSLLEPSEWIPEAAIDAVVMEAPTDVSPSSAEGEIPPVEIPEPPYLPIDWVAPVNAESVAIDPAAAEEIALPSPENPATSLVYAQINESLQTLAPDKIETVRPIVETLAEVVTQIRELQFVITVRSESPQLSEMAIEHVSSQPIILVEAEQKLTELCEELFALLGLPCDENVLARFKHFVLQADDVEALLAMPVRYVADGEGTHEFLRWPLKIMRQFVQFVQEKLERLHTSLGYAAMYSLPTAG